jgi:uncharacterized membrane protein
MIMQPETHNDSLMAPRNLPYLVSGLYLLGFLVAFVPALVGFIFCFVFKQPDENSWINAHLSYHKRTFVGGAVFWLAFMLIFGGSIISASLSAGASGAPMAGATVFGFLGGFMLFFVAGFVWMAWTIARCIISILKCNEQLPMPNPKSWLW